VSKLGAQPGHFCFSSGSALNELHLNGSITSSVRLRKFETCPDWGGRTLVRTSRRGKQVVHCAFANTPPKSIRYPLSALVDRHETSEREVVRGTRGARYTRAFSSPPAMNPEQSRPSLVRGFGLLEATAANMLNMIDVGPFLTIPFAIAAMRGPQAMLPRSDANSRPGPR